ncbi:hypothetical protein JW698_00900 [Candidatus Wolfebacteria bacterium]|nr:hypothetical protein [Candidatus Wolfebacteria bacterium]
MEAQGWTETLIISFQNVWAGIINFLPSLIGALILIIVGLIVAAGLRALIEKIINTLKLDSVLKKVGLDPIFERAGLQLNSGKFIGLLFYWFLVIVFVLAVTDILGLYGVSLFLKDVVSYIPNIIVAVLIMLVAVMVANFLRSIIKASVKGAKLHNSKFLSSLAWWVIIVFGFLAALIQVGIAVTILNTLITGLIAMLALAGGIAFGLGGKDYAASLLEKFRQQTEDR